MQVSGILIFTGILLLSCMQHPDTGKDVKRTRTDSITFPQKSRLNVLDTLSDEIASVIAGNKPTTGCVTLAGEKDWTTYQRHINEDWKLVIKNKTGPIERWRMKNLDTLASDSLALFYPFAGADFLYANAFFPDAANYILIGLEPVGKLHRCDTMTNKNFLSYLEKIRSALYFSNQLGFFRTKSMEKDLREQALDGTLPLILFYVKKTGHRLAGISYFNIGSKGEIVPCRQDSSTIGVRITFSDSTLKKNHELYYLSYDLSDKNLQKHPELLLFVKSFGDQAGFLKAASYLMFTSGFKLIRNYMLNNESAILQDDSGIPYRFFRSGWSVRLYGTYTKTIDLFKYKFQPDLQSAYEKQETSHPVPFRIGYNVKFNETNLLFAKKKK